MNKFQVKRRYLLSMFFLTCNQRDLNKSIFLQLLSEFMIEQLIWKGIADPEEFYGQDSNEYMDFIERREIL